MQIIRRVLQQIKSPIGATLLAIGLIFLISDYHFRWKNDQWKYAVHTDAARYYRYLPMVFINHHIDSPEENQEAVKYFVGTAIFYSPFFGMAYMASVLTGQPRDGYSKYFPVFISFGTLIYLLIGFIYFAGFLRFYLFSDRTICLVLFAASFGTLIFNYTVITPGWSHIIAFALISFLLYYGKKVIQEVSAFGIIALMAGFSILFFTRPSDLSVFILFPFLAERKEVIYSTFQKIIHKKEILVIGSIIALIPMLIQVCLYKASTGKFLIWSYTHEGFDFLHPEFYGVLFGYTKGLFVYTPLCFISLFGLTVLYKRDHLLFLGILLFSILNTWLISSWWCWNYGASFGARVFIDFYPLFLLLLAFLLEIKNKIIHVGLIALIAVCIYMNLFQTYQASHGILDVDFKTESKGFWKIFLKTDQGYSGKYFRFPVNESADNVIGRTIFVNDMERKDTLWINSNTQSSEVAHSGKYSSKVNQNQNFSTGKYILWNEFPYKKNVLIRASGWFMVKEKNNHSFFALSFSNSGKSINFNPFALDGYIEQEGKWEYLVFEMYMPKFPKKIETQKGNQLEVYLYNNSDTDCFVDDLKIEFIEFKTMDRYLDNFWDR